MKEIIFKSGYTLDERIKYLKDMKLSAISLRDGGYITEDEFEKILKRINDDICKDLKELGEV